MSSRAVPVDEGIRPKRLDDFTGQDDLRANLRIFLQAAREREQALDHTLFYGPPRLVTMAARSPLRSRTGPDVVTRLTPNSLAMI